MAWFGDRFARLVRQGLPGMFSATRFDGETNVTYSFTGGSESEIDRLPVDALWRSQPHLRTVVNFLARNVAQLGLHTYRARGGSNERLSGDLVSDILGRPNPQMTRYEMVYSLVGDLALYDSAYLLVADDVRQPRGKSLWVLPASWVERKQKSFFDPPHYEVWVEGMARPVGFTDDEVVAFRGWNPGDPSSSSSPVETLRLILEEQHHSRVHRKQLWKKNGRIGSYVTRPDSAPSWDNTARARFTEMLEAFTGDRGSRAGGMPLLEDGMDMKRVGFSSADEQWIESTKVSLATVAQVYHVNPTMIGLLDNANYSNVREFRRSLYGDTLGPILAMLEGRFNTFLLPRIGGPSNHFVEFNVEQKLRGSFEDQARYMMSAIGSPWMTRNEGRRLHNLPAVDGGDELITPLNVVEGGQVSPVDGGDPAGVQPEPETLKQVVSDHVDRVQRVWDAKQVFDVERFTRELEHDLEERGQPPGFSVLINSHIGAKLDNNEPLDSGFFIDLLQEETS